jgi:predicted dehydrogenase
MPPGLGAIGLGGLGYIELDVLAEFEDVDIVAGADISPDARSLFETDFDAPAYSDHGAMLDAHEAALDAILITTPHTLHYEHAMDCLRRDLAVYLEKPMVTDVGDAVDLVATARERSIELQVGYQRHFHPAFEEIRRIIKEGRIGRVHCANCYLGQNWIDLHREDWRTDPSLSGGGQLYDSGSHLLDALLWTTDTKPKSVTAQMEYAKPDVDVNSALSIQLEGEETLIASVGLSGDGIDVAPSEGYFFWGTEGRISYMQDRITVAEKDAMTYSTEITGGTDFQTLNRKKLENFIESIEGVSEPAVPGDVGLQVTALTEATYRAAESGTKIQVQEFIEKARSRRE